MFIIGLTGGIASGKSTVSRMLEEKGALLLDADRIAREVAVSYTHLFVINLYANIKFMAIV